MAKKDYSNWNNKELIQRIHALEKRKKYGLVWDVEREPENVVLESANSLPVFTEFAENDIVNEPGAKPHILIEGDNFHALSVLNYTHKKAIDVIYIDPPYNTGAEDWKYNNNFVDKENGYRHSKWLSFMNNRLKLAKNLLKPKGVLICAIDKNEQERLGLLLEQVFQGHEMHCITIVHNPAGVQGKNFSYTHEYAYFVFPNNAQVIGKTKRDNDLVSPLRDWGTISKRDQAKTCFYPIIVKDGEIIEFGNVCKDDFHPGSANITRADNTIEIYPIDQHGIERKWVFSRKNAIQIRNELFCKDNKGEVVIMRKKSLFQYRTVWTDKKFYANIHGSSLLNRIIDESFPFPKSLYTVKECLDAVASDNKEAIILDYFAGSGTTAHAVFEMNRADGGNRKVILCTNNEGGICEKVCYPRVKRIIKGYKSESRIPVLLYDRKLSFKDLTIANEILEEIDGMKEKHLGKYNKYETKFEDNTIKVFGVTEKQNKVEGYNGNLKYYRTAFVPAEPTDKNKELLTKQSVEMLCLRECTFDFVKETKIWKLYRNKQRHTGILFDQTQIPAFKKELLKLNTAVSVYVFSLGDDDFADDFSEMKNIKVCSIPEAILRVYRKIFK